MVDRLGWTLWARSLLTQANVSDQHLRPCLRRLRLECEPLSERSGNCARSAGSVHLRSAHLPLPCMSGGGTCGYHVRYSWLISGQRGCGYHLLPSPRVRGSNPVTNQQQSAPPLPRANNHPEVETMCANPMGTVGGGRNTLGRGRVRRHRARAARVAARHATGALYQSSPCPLLSRGSSGGHSPARAKLACLFGILSVGKAVVRRKGAVENECLSTYEFTASNHVTIDSEESRDN
eukprot:3595807-Pleurochrysis_carterae.AAC.1